MTVVGIDPGPTETGVLIIRHGLILSHGKLTNLDMMLEILLLDFRLDDLYFGIEMVQSYGMAVGKEVFETCVWHGQFLWQAGCFVPNERIFRPTRKEIVSHICGSAKAKDANVRQAMLDRWGPQGTKKAPGPTYGISKDVWAALAVASWTLDKVEGRA